MTGRKLLLTEEKQTEFLQLVSVAVWAVRKLRSYLQIASVVEVVLPHQEMVRCVRDKEVHLALRAKLLDMDLYGVQWVAGKTVW